MNFQTLRLKLERAILSEGIWLTCGISSGTLPIHESDLIWQTPAVLGTSDSQWRCMIANPTHHPELKPWPETSFWDALGMRWCQECWHDTHLLSFCTALSGATSWFYLFVAAEETRTYSTRRLSNFYPANIISKAPPVYSFSLTLFATKVIHVLIL